jgi:hypothetical protein
MPTINDVYTQGSQIANQLQQMLQDLQEGYLHNVNFHGDTKTDTETIIELINALGVLMGELATLISSRYLKLTQI